jgi:hypothetical protein
LQTTRTTRTPPSVVSISIDRIPRLAVTDDLPTGIVGALLRAILLIVRWHPSPRVDELHDGRNNAS